MARIKRAVVVARVSTKQQADRGTSLQTQLEGGRKYAELHQMSVVDEITDAGVSGTIPIRSRQGGKKLYDYIDRKSVDAVIFSTLDRVARDEDGLEVLSLRKDLRNAGIELHYVDTGISDLSGMGGLFDYFKAIGAAEERKKILSRNMAGRWQKALNGHYVASGKTPYGFIDTKDGLVIDPIASKIVLLIYKWYLQGDDDGKPATIRGIAAKLSKMGIATPSEVSGTKYKRKAKGWQPFTVLSILKGEMYCGVYWYGVTQWKDNKKIERRREPVSVAIPAIVDRETWQQVQLQLKRNAKMNIRRTTREYLLRGFVKCGQCGGAMVGKAQREPRDKTVWRTYYRCNKANFNRDRIADKERCNLRYVPARWIEDEAWQFVMQTIKGDGFEALLREAQTQEAERQKPLVDELNTVNEMISACSREADALVKQMSRITTSLMQTALERNVVDLETRHQSLTRRKAEIENRITATIVTDEDIAAAIRFREDVLSGLDLATIDNKRAILEILNVCVTIYPNKSDGDKARIDINLVSNPISFEIGTSQPQAPPYNQSPPR